MSLNGFLAVPDIAGESTVAGHEGEIDVHSLDWSISYKTAGKTSRGRTRAETKVGALSVEKVYDASSPYLTLASLSGKAFDEIVLSVRQDSGEAHLDYLKITLTNAFISSYDILRSDDASTLIQERVGLSFEEVKVLYTVQADDHSAGDEHEIEYDIAAGV